MLKERRFYNGVNFGGWFSQCSYDKEHFESFITEDDFKNAASWGIDHIRFPFDYNLLEIQDGASRIENALELCDKYSLNAVLDLHKTKGFSFDYYSESESGFFDNEAYQEYFYTLWEDMAKKFGRYSDKIAFELLNEVTDKKFIASWNKIAGRCIERIRSYAPETLIFIGSYDNNDARAVKALDAPADDNVIYNMHCYEPLKFTHQGAYWTDKIDPEKRMSFKESKADPKYFEVLFDSAIEKTIENNTALYCGEYGVIDIVSPEDTLEWYKTVHKVFEKHGIGRSAWTYKGKDFGLSEPRLDCVRKSLVQLL